MRMQRKIYIIASVLLVGMIVAISLIVIGLRQQFSGESPSPIGTPGGTPPPNPVTTITPTAGGKALYVSPSGNDSNDGSQGHPFATITKAGKVATPGTVVHVLP